MAHSKPAKLPAKSKKAAPAKAAKRAGKPAVKPPAKVAKPAAKPSKPAPKAARPAGKILKLVARPVQKVNGKQKQQTPVVVAKPTAANGKPLKPVKPVVLTPFLKKQKEKLLQLRDTMLDSMMGVAKDNLRTRAEGSEASAFGMHQADAGSDAYDRDFALSLLSQEQDALYEIDEALKRIDLGAYGVCEMSGKPIAHARLEALPFARFTVECQSQIEKMGKVTRARVPVTSLFGLTDEEGGTEGEEEEPATDTKE